MPRGRPKKHITNEEIAEARRERNRQYYIRKRKAQAPPEVISYVPALPGAPTTTYLDLGLRISADIPVPRDPFIQPHESPEDENAYRLRSPLASLAVDDPTTTALVNQLQASEQEQISGCDEYERRILERINETDLRTAEILMEMQMGIGHTRASADETAEHSGDENRPVEPDSVPTDSIAGQSYAVRSSLLRLSVAPVAKEATAAEEVNVANTHSVSYTFTPTLAKAANASAGALNSPQIPNQRSSVSSTRSSTRDGRRKAFPAQSNTLLSWVKHVPRQPSTSSNTLQLLLPSPGYSTPLPPPLSSHCSIPRLLQLFNSNRTPQPATQRTPAAASPSPVTHSGNLPRPGAAQAASAVQSTARGDSLPTERTAYKLAKHLRSFQGCTHEEHAEADRRHQEHHQRADVHSACSSLEEITCLINGVHNGGTPLPDILSNPKLMKSSSLPEGLDLKAAFEGTSPSAFPEDVGTPNEKLPRNLCLQQHHHSSNKGRAAKVRFDIDSVCYFPSSLGFARNGIDWHPRVHPILNLDADIHFSLTVSAYSRRGDLAMRNLPLHKIPHYCFGSVAGSTKSLLLFIFFPELHLESQYQHSTYLSKQDQQLWLDAVLLPAISKTVDDSTLASYLPASEDNASRAVTAVSAETFKRKESTHRFCSPTLFVHAKNTKLAHMADDLSVAYQRWEEAWTEAADPQFYSKDRTYVDIAKTITSEDYAYPYDSVPEQFEAETFLWKRCCLESYARTCVKLLEDGKRAQGSPQVATYPWATMRDSMGQTLSTVPRGQENMDGLVYSQFYANIKTPFDDSKVYVFDNEAIENLALDPGYVRSLQQQGGSATFSESVCKASYLHSKRRAFSNLRDNQRRSYGIREEHRVSLTMLEEICEQWHEWDLYDDSIDHLRPPLPYFIIPSQALFGFLSAQINKYCLLFEHTLVHTARTYSLPETMVMVIALRALRFCYGSTMLVRESLLYKDRWEQRRGQEMVVKEGLGMQETMGRCGLGWFLPKFRWAMQRLTQPHGDNMLVGNLLMHAEYKRRQQAGTSSTVSSSTLGCSEHGWSIYMHSTWSSSTPTYGHRCWQPTRDVESYRQLLDFLFLWDDGQEHAGWGGTPYRLILQKSFEFVESQLGYQQASRWLDEFFYLVRLTHWILPYPSNKALITSTKESCTQNLIG
ncbi:uncharacterized protein EI97DRAFT_438948 [Westerdykella ornata]|uniref:Uncharacterized protein n=1 Tax=Westerdykella ornata TaxID=318751 RepID=A0A6A6JTE2_WESOR|nr:uncharacterized protein EI97DRAFT_438948 [Westerdykella ornata]KAF2279842.1 hypothetical protein EI97DRAFT_438948 [Westerdykella ornata]